MTKEDIEKLKNHCIGKILEISNRLVKDGYTVEMSNTHYSIIVECSFGNYKERLHFEYMGFSNAEMAISYFDRLFEKFKNKYYKQ